MTAYLKLRSWHVVERVDAAGWRTLCGRIVNEDAPAAEELPMGEKSCESCLRVRTDRLEDVLAAAEAAERDPDTGTVEDI